MTNTQFNSTQDYVASEELLASVNVAIALQKPLLIKGSRAQARPCSRRQSRTRSAKAYHMEYQVHDKGTGRLVYV